MSMNDGSLEPAGPIQCPISTAPGIFFIAAGQPPKSICCPEKILIAIRRSRNAPGTLMKQSQPPTTNTGEIRSVNNLEMNLIPWRDIWVSLMAARCRGQGQMIEVFYDTLFKEATFDDKGAWARRLPK
jgi:hypothetical protein